MAASTAKGNMVLRMSVDDSRVTPTLNTMKQEIRDINASWRANVESAKAAGDAQEAARAKVDGLSLAANQQKELLTQMNAIMQTTGVRTAENGTAYDRLSSTIGRAEAQYKNMLSQQKVAIQTLERQETGIDGLNKNIKASNELSQAQVNALKAQGQEYASNELKLKSLQEAHQKLTVSAQKEEEILAKVAARSGVTSTAYYTQATAVQNAKNKILENEQATARYQERTDKTNVQLTDLKRNYEQLKTSQDSYITRLRAEGKENEANVADVNKLRTSYQNLSEQYTLQNKKMSSSNVGSAGYKEAYVQAQKTATEMARVKNQAYATQKEINSMNPFGVSKIGTAFNKAGNSAKYLQSKTVSAYQYIRRNATAIALSAGVIGAAFLKGAQEAVEVENTYTKVTNLIQTGASSAVASTKEGTKAHTEALKEYNNAQNSSNEMLKDGQKYSVQYGFSQKDIASGYQDMIKRGYDSQQALGAQKTMLEAARATGDDYNTVVRNTSTALENFNMKGKTSTETLKNSKIAANEMAYAADATATDFNSLGKAMEYVGPTAHNAGISLSETSSAIGILSNNGLEADKAGTGLRKAISSLLTPTKGAQGALESLGLSTSDFVDKSGKMKSMSEIFSLLNEHSKDLSKADRVSVFHSIFGATGEAAGNILATNAKQLGELNEKVKASADGSGYITKLSEKNMQSTAARLAQLKAIIEQVSMTIGQAMLPALNEASKGLAKAFSSKDGQEGLKTIAKGVGTVLNGLVDLVSFIGQHGTAVKVLASALVGIFAIKKVGDFTTMIKNLLIPFKTMRDLAVETAAAEALIGTGGKTGAATTVSRGLASGGASAVEGAVLSTAGGAGTGTVAGKASLSGISGILGSTAGKLALGGLGTVIAVAPSIISGATSKTIEGKGSNYGSAAGGLAGAASGALLGSAFGPVGTAIGGVAGGLAGSKYGKEFGKKWAEATKLANPKNTTLWLGKGWRKQFSKPTAAAKKLAKDYDSMVKSINQNTINPSAKTSNIEGAQKKVSAAYEKMKKSITDYYDKVNKTSNKDLAILVKNGVLSQKEADAIAKKRNKTSKDSADREKKVVEDLKKTSRNYYKDVEKIQNGGSKKLQEIAKKYGKNSVQYEKEKKKELETANKKYVKTIASQESKLNSQVSKIAQTASQKQKDIMTDLTKAKGKASAKQVSEAVSSSNKQKNTLIKDANETYKKSVSSAQSKYKDTVAAADKEYYQNKSISKSQHDKLIENAKNIKNKVVGSAEDQRDKAVNAAKDQHKKVVSEAEQQKVNHGKQIDAETGLVIGSSNEQAKGQTDVLNKIIDGINWVTKFFGMGAIKHVSFTPTKAGNVQARYATGTRGTKTDEVALVGEEGFELAHTPGVGIHVLGSGGAEIRHLKAGTSILPHEMSKQFLAMTNGLPAHKDGVPGFLSDAFNWVKDTTTSAMSFVNKGASSVVNSITDSLGANYGLSNSQFSKKLLVGGVDYAKDGAVDWLKGIFKKKEESETSAPTGSGASRWRNQVEDALTANGLSTGLTGKVLRQIQSESGGNEKAVQGGYTDVNTLSGDLAKGLMQTISATFNAYAFPGHKDIFNGYDNLLAALAYAKNRYGTNLDSLGEGHGYANGGLITKHQIAEIGEGNQPEMIIPLSSMKSSRGFELIGQTAVAMAARDGLTDSSSTTSQGAATINLDETNDKLDTLINGINTLAVVITQQLNGSNISGLLKSSQSLTNTANRLAGVTK